MTQSQSITFFIDRCLGNKCIVETLRGAGLTIEIHDEHFSKGAQDVEWLPEVGKRGWVVITKDGKIGNNSLERIAVAQAKIKMFTFASQSLLGEEMSRILLAAIIKMQSFVYKNPAPFIAKIYRDGKISMWKDNKTLEDELQKFL